MKTKKIAYWIFTSIMCLVLAGSVFMYFSKTSTVKEAFLGFGYPTYIVIPLAIAKILAIVAIISGLSNTLKEWAYFGLLMDFALAATAHLVLADGQAAGAFIALGAWMASYFLWKQI